MKKIISISFVLLLLLGISSVAFAGTYNYAWYSTLYNEISRRGVYQQNDWHKEYITFDDDKHTEVEYGSPVQCTYDEYLYYAQFENHTPTGKHKVYHYCSVCNNRKDSLTYLEDCNFVHVSWTSNGKKGHSEWQQCTKCGAERNVNFTEHDYDDGIIIEKNSEYHVIKYTCKDCGYTKEATINHTDDYVVQVTPFGQYENLGTNHEIAFRCADCGRYRWFQYKHNVDMSTVRYVCDHTNDVYYTEAYCAGCNSWIKVEDIENPEYTSEDYYTYMNQTYCDRTTTTRCYHCNYIKTTRSHYAHVVVTNSLTGETFCKNCGHEIASDRAYEPPEDEPLIQHEHTFRHVKHISANEWHNGYDLNRCECGEEDKYYMTEEPRLYNPELDGKTFTDCVKYLIKIRQPKNSEELNDVFAEARTYFDL